MRPTFSSPLSVLAGYFFSFSARATISGGGANETPIDVEMKFRHFSIRLSSEVNGGSEASLGHDEEQLSPMKEKRRSRLKLSSSDAQCCACGSTPDVGQVRSSDVPRDPRVGLIWLV